MLHLRGGQRDGERIDTDDATWGAVGEPWPPPMLPPTIEVDSARANRAAYRLVRADGDEGWYDLDPEASRRYREAR